jgi:hypothetical protein
VANRSKLTVGSSYASGVYIENEFLGLSSCCGVKSLTRDKPGESKVTQFDLSVYGQQNIGSLDITVNDVIHVKVAECVDQLADDVANQLLG